MKSFSITTCAAITVFAYIDVITFYFNLINQDNSFFDKILFLHKLKNVTNQITLVLHRMVLHWLIGAAWA